MDRGPELRGVAAPLLPTLGVAAAFGVPLADPRGGVGADPRGDSGLRLRYLAGPTIKTPNRAALLAARQPPLRLEIRVRPRPYRAHTHSAREEDGFNVA